MSNRSRALTALTLLLTLAPASSALAWPAVEPDGHRTSLLGGRWTVVLPESARPAFTQPQPGQPVPRPEVDGLVMLETDEGHFALHATLLESTRPDDLTAAVRALPAACASPTYGPLGERTDVVVERCSDVSPDGAFRPMIVFAVHPDGWVDRIEALVETGDPDDLAGRTAGAAYVEAVFATLVAGLPSGESPIAHGTVELDHACVAGDESDALTLTLPEGWIATRDTTSSVTLVRVTHVVPLGDARPMIAVEIVPAGAVPQRVPEGVGTLVEGTLLAQPIQWLVIESEGQPTGVRRTSTELTIDCGGGATYARALSLSVGGPVASLDEAQRIVESLNIQGGRGHTADITSVSVVEAALAEAESVDADREHAAEQQGHFWSIAIGAGSMLLLGAALVMRSKTTRPK